MKIITKIKFWLVLLSVVPILGVSAYTIQKGDTLTAISRKLGISVEELKEKNNIVNPNLIYEGQIIETESLGGDITPNKVIKFLNQLKDVSVSSPSGGELLGYDSTQSLWTNTSTIGTLSFSGNLLPSSNNAYTLGSPSLLWAGLYTDDLFVNSIVSSSLSVQGGVNPSSDNLYDVGASSTQWRYGNFQGGVLVADGSTTGTYTKNTLELGKASGYNEGVFNVDSSGNVNASGTVIKLNGSGIGYIQTPTQFNVTVAGSNSGIFGSSFLSAGGAGRSLGTWGNAWQNINAYGTLTLGSALGGGVSTSTLTSSTFNFGKTATYPDGVFTLNSSGNISASGTLKIYGSFTSGDSAFDSLFSSGIIKGSSTLLIGTSAGDNFFVNGQFITASGSLAIGKSSAGYAQLDIKASSSLAIPFNIADEDGNDRLWFSESEGLNVKNDAGDYSIFSPTNLTVGYGVNPFGNIKLDGGTGRVSASGSLYTYANVTSTGIIYGLNGLISSASSTFTSNLNVSGNTLFGDSDAAGGDTTRVYGSLAMGAASTGNAQLYLNASSTTALPLLVQGSTGGAGTTFDYLTQWKDSSGNVIASLSTSTQTVIDPTGVAINYRNDPLLVIGKNSAVNSGRIELRGSNPTLMIAEGSDGRIKGYLDGFGLFVADTGAFTTSSFGADGIYLGMDGTHDEGLFFADATTGDVFSSGTVFKMPLATNITGNGVCITAGNQITNAGAAACVPSALRFKTNIKDREQSALKEISRLRVRDYERKDQRGSPRIGFIAEEVADVNKNLVVYDKYGDALTLHFEDITALNSKAIQELNEKISQPLSESNRYLWFALGFLFLLNMVQFIKKRFS